MGLLRNPDVISMSSCPTGSAEPGRATFNSVIREPARSLRLIALLMSASGLYSGPRRPRSAPTCRPIRSCWHTDPTSSTATSPIRARRSRAATPSSRSLGTTLTTSSSAVEVVEDQAGITPLRPPCQESRGRRLHPRGAARRIGPVDPGDRTLRDADRHRAGFDHACVVRTPAVAWGHYRRGAGRPDRRCRLGACCRSRRLRRWSSTERW